MVATAVISLDHYSIIDVLKCLLIFEISGIDDSVTRKVLKPQVKNRQYSNCHIFFILYIHLNLFHG